MRSRLFHAVVAGGLGFGAAAIACSDAEQTVEPASIATADAEPPANADAGSPYDAAADADASKAIADAASEDSGWHPTK
jgi:hypothetical protein